MKSRREDSLSAEVRGQGSGSSWDLRLLRRHGPAFLEAADGAGGGLTSPDSALLSDGEAGVSSRARLALMA